MDKFIEEVAGLAKRRNNLQANLKRLKTHEVAFDSLCTISVISGYCGNAAFDTVSLGREGLEIVYRTLMTHALDELGVVELKLRTLMIEGYREEE